MLPHYWGKLRNMESDSFVVERKRWIFSIIHHFFLSSKKVLLTYIAVATSIWQRRFGGKKKKIKNN